MQKRVCRFVPDYSGQIRKDEFGNRHTAIDRRRFGLAGPRQSLWLNDLGNLSLPI